MKTLFKFLASLFSKDENKELVKAVLGVFHKNPHASAECLCTYASWQCDIEKDNLELIRMAGYYKHQDKDSLPLEFYVTNFDLIKFQK